MELINELWYCPLFSRNPPRVDDQQVVLYAEQSRQLVAVHPVDGGPNSADCPGPGIAWLGHDQATCGAVHSMPAPGRLQQLALQLATEAQRQRRWLGWTGFALPGMRTTA